LGFLTSTFGASGPLGGLPGISGPLGGLGALGGFIVGGLKPGSLALGIFAFAIYN
jgi:hypothetical protein